MPVHCPFCDDQVEPNPNSVHCPGCGNPIPELKEKEESQSPAAGASGEANVAGQSSEAGDGPSNSGSAAPAQPVSEDGDEESVESSDQGADGSTCPSCGEPIEEDWDACPYCTTDLGQQEPVDQTPATCPECEYGPIEGAMNICPKCKTSLPGKGSTPGAHEPAHPAASDEVGTEEGVVLNFDAGGSMEVTDGTTLGTELRQHLHDNGFPTEDAMRISRQHLLFKQTPSGFQVVDLESTNGTELNGEKLEPNREYQISDGDRLELGGTTEITIQIQ